MKKYIAKLDRESISLDIGFKIVVVKNGTEYMESELTAKFPKYFVEASEVEVEASEVEVKPEPVVEASEVEVKPEPVVEASEEELLLDNSSAVEATSVPEEVDVTKSVKKDK
jgi:hypothetical protein